MPIDPSIPLAVKPFTLDTPFQLASGAAKIQGQQTENALADTKVQAFQQQQQTRNAMIQLSQQQGMKDANGMYTPAFANAIAAYSPEAAQAVQKQIIDNRHKMAQEGDWNSQSKQREMDAQIKQSTLTRQYFVSALGEYYSALKASNGNDDIATQAMNKSLQDSHDASAKTGLFPNLAPFKPMDKDQVLYNMSTADEHAKSLAEMQKQAGTLSRPVPMDDKLVTFQRQPDGTQSPRFMAPNPALMNANTAATRAQILQQQVANSTLPPEVSEGMARQARTGDTTVFQNLGRGQQGAANIVGLRKDMYRLDQAAGTTPEEQAAKNAEFMGLKAGERTLGTRQANVDMAVSEAQNLVPLALQASDEAKRAGVKSVNDLLQYAQGKTSSPELRRLSVATNTLINVYARAISPVGVPTDTDKNHAREVLDKGFSNGDYKAAVGQLVLEMSAAQKSPGQVRANIRGAITGNQAPNTQVPLEDPLGIRSK